MLLSCLYTLLLNSPKRLEYDFHLFLEIIRLYTLYSESNYDFKCYFNESQCLGLFNTTHNLMLYALNITLLEPNVRVFHSAQMIRLIHTWLALSAMSSFGGKEALRTLSPQPSGKTETGKVILT